MIKFSVITICYNAVDCIIATVESVLNQTYGNIEYIIVDGKSTDGTLAEIEQIVANDNRVTVFSEKDFGIYNAMNRGIVRASGDYVIFMNAGDLFYDNHVLEKASFIISKNGCAIYYGRAWGVRSGARIAVKEFADIRGNDFVRLLKGYMPRHQAIIAPLYWLKRFYFDERYRLRADFDWLVKCNRQGVPFYSLDITICKYDYLGEASDLRTKAKKMLKIETKKILSENHPIVGRFWNHFGYLFNK